MEEKSSKKPNKKTVVKRVYSPPIVTVYGKLSELTAGGVGTASEAGSMSSNKMP